MLLFKKIKIFEKKDTKRGKILILVKYGEKFLQSYQEPCPLIVGVV